jgi:hypothetical protein
LIQNELWVPTCCHAYFKVFLLILKIFKRCHQDFNLGVFMIGVPRKNDLYFKNCKGQLWILKKFTSMSKPLVSGNALRGTMSHLRIWAHLLRYHHNIWKQCNENIGGFEFPLHMGYVFMTNELRKIHKSFLEKKMKCTKLQPETTLTNYGALCIGL